MYVNIIYKECHSLYNKLSYTIVKKCYTWNDVKSLMLSTTKPISILILIKSTYTIVYVDIGKSRIVCRFLSISIVCSLYVYAWYSHYYTIN